MPRSPVGACPSATNWSCSGPTIASVPRQPTSSFERSEPTALFCSNSRAAISLAPILGDGGLAVTAYGDFPLADLLTPSLTVIDQNPHELGRLAAQRIFDRLDHPTRRFRRSNVLPGPNLVERSSCKVTDRLEGADAQVVERENRPTG